MIDIDELQISVQNQCFFLFIPYVLQRKHNYDDLYDLIEANIICH